MRYPVDKMNPINKFDVTPSATAMLKKKKKACSAAKRAPKFSEYNYKTWNSGLKVQFACKSNIFKLFSQRKRPN